MSFKYKSFNSKRKFGVEIELSNNLNSQQIREVISKITPNRVIYNNETWASTGNGNDFWHIKRDSTCGPEGKTTSLDKYGYEIASYVGRGAKDLLLISKVVPELKKAGAVINNHCGLHIHADCSDLKLEQASVVMAYWCKIERTLFHSCPSHRRGNKYCKSIRTKVPASSSLTSLEFWDKIKPSQLHTHENDDKKVSLNSVGYTAWQTNQRSDDSKNTLELRMPEASLSRNDIVNWVRLYLNFIDNVKDAKMPDSRRVVRVKDSLRILGLHGIKNFLILSPGLRKTKVWFLKRLIKNSGVDVLSREAQRILKESMTL